MDKFNLRSFIRSNFREWPSFTARDVTRVLRAAHITVRRGAVTDALYHMNGTEVQRRPELEERRARRFGSSVGTRFYTFITKA